MEADDLRIMEELFGEENVIVIESVSDLEALEIFLTRSDLHDSDEEKNGNWCDRCGTYHGGECLNGD